MNTDSSKADTPLFRQYNGIKSQHPDKLLFFRMGDFFELFFSDAIKASALLGITVTKRRSTGEPIPMAGVPASSHEQYVSKLVRMGESVVICDQVGVTADGGLMERKVTQIVTPGTLTDQSLLPERGSCVAMSITHAKDEAGYAWLDLARGELRAGQCSINKVADHFFRMQPAEVLMSEGTSLPAGISTCVHHLPQWEFETTSAKHRMCERFEVTDLQGFGLEDKPLAVACCMALLCYAEQTQCRKLDHIWRIGAENDDSYLFLDAQARSSLEISVSLKSDGPSLLSCIDECVTSMGSRLLEARLRNPLSDQKRINKRLDAIELVTEKKEGIRKWLKNCCDIERIVTRISLSSVRPRELTSLRDTLTNLPDLCNIVASLSFEDNKRFAPIIFDHSAVVNLLTTALAQEPQPTLKDGGVICKGFNAELDKLLDMHSYVKNMLSDIEERERNNVGTEALKVGHNRVHGFFIELPRSKSDLAPERYQRLQTTKHAERYSITELALLHEQSLSASEKSVEIERQLYIQLVEGVNSYAKLLRELAEALTELDVSATLALIKSQRKWCRPKLTSKTTLSIKEGRHPVVEQAVDHFVPNPTLLDNSDRMEVITGPNMGGKSTYMRQVALIVLLAHAGMPVPAKSATIGKFDSIMTRIGASDDLAGGRSTFMVEMAETAAILNNATAATLVILDEIGRGTSTYDGLSIAWATAQTLLERNKSLVLLATHYLELAELSKQQTACKNVHMAVDDTGSKPVMMHRVKEGALSQSFGIHVATMAGVPNHSIKLARKVLKTLNEQTQDKSQQSLLDIKEEKLEANQTLERLRETDIDSLSPRQALELLYSLRDLDNNEN